MAKSIKLNLFYNILLNVSKVVFPLITAPYVARVLEPEGVGIFNFANTFAQYFALFAALGIPMYAVREIAKIREDVKAQERFVSEIMSLSFFTTALCTVIYVLTVFLIPQLNDNYVLFLLAGLILYFVPFSIDWFYSGREEFGYITFRSLVIRTLSIILLFVFVRDKDDVAIYVLLNGLAQVLNIAWNYIKLLQNGVRPSFTLSFKKHLKPLLILFSSSVAISIYTVLDTLMLGFMSNYDQVGYYNSATHISKTLLPIATSLAAVAMPRLSYYMKSNDWGKINDLMNKSLSVVSFLCFPIAFGVLAIAPTFVPLFFGEMFYGAILPLQIVIGVVVAIGLNNLWGVQVLVGLGYDKMFLYAVLVGTISNFLCNLLLIPIYGASGAAFASVLAESLILVVEIFMVHKLTPIRFTRIKELIISAILAICLIPLQYLLSTIVSGWYLVGLFFIVGGLLYTILQILFKNSSAMVFVSIIKSKLTHEKTC